MMAAAHALNISTRITLNQGGVSMPMFGLGLFRAENNLTTNLCKVAIKNGYRLLDTAELYGNEAETGKGVLESGEKREDIFVVSKVWNSNHGYDKCTKTFEKCLESMGLDYIDLYLIHAPAGGRNVETYDAMLDLQKKGLIKAVGVSNFGIHHLEGLRKAGKPTPAVNQIELHPFFPQKDVVDYCREHNIAVMGYCPVARMEKKDDPTLVSIAKKHNKSVAQVMIRWSLQKDFITIPKSSKPERIVENADVFDWSLDDEDMDKMVDLASFKCSTQNAQFEAPWTD